MEQKKYNDLLEKMKESGHNLLSKTLDILENNKWSCEISCYYGDDTTNSPREIDVVATKNLKDIDNSLDNDFYIKIFIECKCFTEDICFRFVKYNEEKLHKSISAEGIEPSHCCLKNWDKKEINVVYDYYSSYDQKNNNRDNVFKGFSGPTKALIFYETKHNYKNYIYYPVCIYKCLNGKQIYSISLNKDTKTIIDKNCLEKEHRFLFGLNYGYFQDSSCGLTPQTKNVVVDFCNIDKIDDLLNDLKAVITSTIEYLKNKKTN